MKKFKRWGVEDLLKLSGHAMKHVFIKDRLLEALLMKWKDAKMSNLEITLQMLSSMLPHYKIRMLGHTQPHLTILIALALKEPLHSSNSLTQVGC